MIDISVVLQENTNLILFYINSWRIQFNCDDPPLILNQVTQKQYFNFDKCNIISLIQAEGVYSSQIKQSYGILAYYFSLRIGKYLAKLWYISPVTKRVRHQFVKRNSQEFYILFKLIMFDLMELNGYILDIE